MPDADAIATFCELLATSLAEGRFASAVLAKYRGTEPGLERIDLRGVVLRDTPMVQWVYHHATRDITKNLSRTDTAALLPTLLGSNAFRAGHLHTLTEAIELSVTQRGQAHLRRTPQAGAAPDDAHNREKQRTVPLTRPFLAALGVTTPEHELVPAMARKWKQINKFVEVFAVALAGSRLADSASISVVDFGAGKGYLTFAIHDWLRETRHVQADVTGVEQRPDMVQLANAASARLGLSGLQFLQGNLHHWQPAPVNVVIALHACDTATDHAIHLALRAGADLILCSPCCHKQLRPQLLSPHPLRPLLQHGIHLGQQAEMLTDSLRALLLESAGYDTQVFEFVSLEHTQKNKMILAVKRAQPKPAEPVLAQIAELKGFWGIREQCLETLMQTAKRARPRY